jgi:hypothetical protein
LYVYWINIGNPSEQNAFSEANNTAVVKKLLAFYKTIKIIAMFTRPLPPFIFSF